MVPQMEEGVIRGKEEKVGNEELGIGVPSFN